MIFKGVVLLVLHCAVLSSQQPSRTKQRAGILGRVNPSGFAFVSQAISDLNVTEIFQDLNLDNVENGPLKVDNIEIRRLDIGSFSLQSFPPNGFTLSVSNLNLATFASVEVSFFFLSFQVNLLFTVEDLSLTQALTLERDRNGGFSVSAGQCDVTIGNVAVMTDDRQYDSLFNRFGGQIRSVVQSMMCSVIDTLIEQQSFEDLTTFGLPFNSTIDLKLISDPIIGRDSLELAFNGRIFPNSFPSLTSTSLIPLIPSLSSTEIGQMFQISLNHYVINTFLVSMQFNNVFVFEISQQQINTYAEAINSNFTLDLTTLTLFNPALASYDPSTEFIMNIAAANPPSVGISTNELSIKGDFFVTVRLPEQNVEVFLLQTNFTIFAEVAGLGGCIQYNVTNASVGFVNVVEGSALYELQPIIEELIPDLLNSVISSPGNLVRLPSFLGYHLDNIYLSLRENAFEMSANIEADGAAGRSPDECLSLEELRELIGGSDDEE